MPIHTLKNFTGGLTENPVGAPDNQVKRFQNLRLNGAGNPASRLGRVLDFTSADLYRVSSDTNDYQRINTLIPYKIDGTNKLLKHVGNKLVWDNGSSYSEIKTPFKKETGCVVYSGTYCIFIPNRATHGIGAFTNIYDFTDDNFTAGNGNITGPYGTYTWATSVNDQIANPTVSTTASSTSVTVSSAALLTKGMRINDVLGTPSAFPDDTYITNISGLTLTMSQAATATVSRVMYFSADVVVPHAFTGSSTNLTLYFWGDKTFRNGNFAFLYGQVTDPFAAIPATPNYNAFYTTDEHDTISKTIYDNHLFVTDKTLKSNPMVIFKNSNNVDGIGTNQVCAIAAGLPRPLSGKTTLFLPGYKNFPETLVGTSNYVQLNSSTTATVPVSSITFSNNYTALYRTMNIFAITPNTANPIPAGTYITAISIVGDTATLTLNQAATATGVFKCDFVQEDIMGLVNYPFSPYGGAGANSGYSWAIVYSYTYQFNGKTYKQYGRPLYILSSSYHAQYYPTLGAEGSISLSLDPAFICPTNCFKRTADAITGFNPDTEDFANRPLVGVDTKNITIEVYRTAANGNVFYFYGSSENRIERKNFEYMTIPSSWSTNNRTLYTTSGVAANYRPPICKYITTSGPYMLYANGHEISESDRGGDLLKNRIWQSKPGLPYAVPADFYAEVDEEIVGIATIKTVPIVFTQNYVYRIDGNFDSFGRGGLYPKRITEVTGCVSDQSIVQTEDGVYFAGTDGFYFTDGFIVRHLSKNISEAYREIISSDNRKALISGGIDIINREVHWSVKTNDIEGSVDECNASFMFDIDANAFYGPNTSGFDDYDADNSTENSAATMVNLNLTSGSKDATVAVSDTTGTLAAGQVIVCDQLPFGTFLITEPSVVAGVYQLKLSRNATATGATFSATLLDPTNGTWMFYNQYQPSCYAYMDNVLYHGDPRGYTFKYSTVAYDQVIDVSNTDATTWQKNPIKYHFATIDSDFGSAASKKYVTKATIKVKFNGYWQSNISIQPKTEVESSGNLENSAAVVAEITGEEEGVTWGSKLLSNINSESKDFQVFLPRTAGFRSTYRSMHLTNAEVKIQSSGIFESIGTIGEPTAVPELKSLTISSGAFLEDIIGYYIRFFEIQDGAVFYTFGDQKFWITDRISDTEIYFVDVENAFSSGNTSDFEIWGIRKRDTLDLQEIDYQFNLMGYGQLKGDQAPSTSGAV